MDNGALERRAATERSHLHAASSMEATPLPQQEDWDGLLVSIEQLYGLMRQGLMAPRDFGHARRVLLTQLLLRPGIPKASKLFALRRLAAGGVLTSDDLQEAHAALDEPAAAPAADPLHHASAPFRRPTMSANQVSNAALMASGVAGPTSTSAPAASSADRHPRSLPPSRNAQRWIQRSEAHDPIHRIQSGAHDGFRHWTGQEFRYRAPKSKHGNFFPSRDPEMHDDEWWALTDSASFFGRLGRKWGILPPEPYPGGESAPPTGHTVPGALRPSKQRRASSPHAASPHAIHIHVHPPATASPGEAAALSAEVAAVVAVRLSQPSPQTPLAPSPDPPPAQPASSSPLPSNSADIQVNSPPRYSFSPARALKEYNCDKENCLNNPASNRGGLEPSASSNKYGSTQRSYTIVFKSGLIKVVSFPSNEATPPSTPLGNPPVSLSPLAQGVFNPQPAEPASAAASSTATAAPAAAAAPSAAASLASRIPARTEQEADTRVSRSSSQFERRMDPHRPPALALPGTPTELKGRSAHKMHLKPNSMDRIRPSPIYSPSSQFRGGLASLMSEGYFAEATLTPKLSTTTAA